MSGITKKSKIRVLLGLWLLSWILPIQAQTAYQPVIFKVSAFVVEGDNPIGKQTANKILAPYLGEQSGLEGLSAAADALEQAIIKAGYSFHRVNLPPQSLEDGTIRFNVIRFSIGEIKVQGNKFYDRENILHTLPGLISGETPNTRELSRTLRMANNSASRKILMKFKEGGSPDSIDAELTVQDSSPQVFFVTLDNTGSSETEEYRTTLGYQHANLFNRDHALTATLTVSPSDFSATRQLGLNYHIPLYAHGANLDFLFSDSEVNSGEVANNIEISGKGSVLGAIYTRPFPSDTGLDHDWHVSMQYKTFDNSVDAAGSVFDSKVVSSPLELGYQLSYQLSSGVLGANAAWLMNLGVGSNNESEDYDAVRPGAENSWSALRYGLSYDWILKGDWLFHADINGQSSDDLLISGEQIGVGGSRSLRGFEERSVTGDKGYDGSLELWTPPWQGLRFLAFFDAASVTFNDAPGYDLSSYGVGARWSWKQQLSVSLDLGIIAKGGGPDPDINQDGDSKAHINLIYRF